MTQSLSISRRSPTIGRMSELIINITWEYFLGIIGSAIVMAYYANGRFTRLETNYEWIVDAIRDLTIKAENLSSKLFDTGSPVTLTRTGQRFLEKSGLKVYIDARKDELVSQLHASERRDFYMVQESAFRLLAGMPLDGLFEQQLNTFAFESGISTDLLRRVGAIYLRDLAAQMN
jgi:hypothetical protein